MKALAHRLHCQLAHGAFHAAHDLAGKVESKVLVHVSAQGAERVLNAPQRPCADLERLVQHRSDAAEGFLQLVGAPLHLFHAQIALHFAEYVEALHGVFQVHAVLQLPERIDGLLGVLFEIPVVEVHRHQALFHFTVHETTSFQTSSAISRKIGRTAGGM